MDRGSNISRDRLDDAMKNEMRNNLLQGWLGAGAPREKAQELADLTVRAVDEAVLALDRVTMTAPRLEDEFSTFLAAMQVMQGVLGGMVNQALALAESLDWNKIDHNFAIGGSSH